MKKILSYITVMAVAAMLAAPVAAYAQEEEKPDVVMNKTVSGPDANGVYNLQLEAYVTGKMIEVERNVRKPADIVLVLDLSGSMSGTYYTYKYTPRKSASYSYYDCKGEDYFYLYNDKYYKVEIADEGGSRDWKCYLYFTVNGVQHWLYGTTDTTTKPDYVDDDDKDIWEGVLYNRKKDQDLGSRMENLKSSVSKFINNVYDDAMEDHNEDGKPDNIAHKISIVKFADNTYYDDSDLHLAEGNHIHEGIIDSYNYTEVVKNFRLVKDCKTELLNSIKELDEVGATAADYGMTLARNVMMQPSYVNDGATKVVILFTDGDPNHSSGFDEEVANSTIEISKELKALGIKVFTIGINASTDSDYFKYMNGVSSNYPSASSLDALGTPDEKMTYFKDAQDGTLSDAFDVVSTEIITEGGASVEVTAEASIVDIVTTDFVLPAGFQKKDILIKVSNYDPSTDSFSTELTNPTEDVKLSDPSVQTDGTTRISVSGYPFSEHWCGEGCGSSGQKLVIIVPIVPSSGCIGGLDIPTNGEDSGLYLPGETEPIATFTPPTVTLPINIIVKKEGLAPGESAIFEILSSDPAATNPVATLILTGGKAGDPAPTAQVTGLDPHFVYTVKESDWSWTYNSNTGSISTKDVSANPFTFKNEKKDVDVKNAEATILNKFEKITK